VRVGVFDLIERGDLPLADCYEQRLQLAELYDRTGFYCYHVAEHHSTPHGVASSPSVLLSAVAQRTKRLRFGPMVYLLPFYPPLRLIEEICMLDQLSRGRLEVGLGRGISPLERAIYGIKADEADRIHAETYQILRFGLTGETLTFHGEMFDFDAVPMQLRPYQQPHPPLWYGTSSLESVDWIAREGLSMAMSVNIATGREATARYRSVWRAAGRTGVPPALALVRKIVVAETDEGAYEIADRAYPRWLADFNFHFTRVGQIRTSGERPPTYAGLAGDGRALAGTPDTVAAALRAQLADSGFNYLIAEFFFGAMSFDDVVRSVELFASCVMPQLELEKVST
jgi:alkanesulfonate monooxygenase SsuD/methylene tetrahydromethanopterin reductase-like flavin-dependent oxidoreductase (luciferase family)